MQLEASLRILFETNDLTLVRNDLLQTIDKMRKGLIPLSMFIFHKEVKLGSYSENGTLPPAVIVALKQMELDPQNVPQHGERIPYLVAVEGGKRLIDQATSPRTFLSSTKYIFILI